MRVIFALPLLLASAACGVDNDPQNDQVTLQYDEGQIQNTAADIGNAAEDAGSAIGNAAEDASNEIGRIDVDVDAREEGETQANAS